MIGNQNSVSSCNDKQMGPDQILPAPFLSLLLPANLLTKITKVLDKQLSWYGAEQRIKKFRAQEETLLHNLLLGVASIE